MSIGINKEAYMNKILQMTLFILPLLLTSCSGNLVRNIASEIPQETVIPENIEWNNYLSTFKTLELQKGCEPRRFTPPVNIKARAKILLVHGFTACPQQYFEWAELLSKRGIVVYLFTMPGHGAPKLPSGKDNYSNLPTHNNFEAYSNLAEVINKVALADELPSSIGGLSVGAAVALNAAETAMTPYKKLILISPFFKMPKYFERNLLGPVIGNLPLINNQTISWGEGCHDELRRGRAGICEYTISDVYTTQVFGKHVISLAQNLSNRTQIQIVGVEKDTGSDNNSTEKFAQIVTDIGNKDLSVCFYPKGANHSLLSRFDSPDENKYWLPSLLEDATNFIDQGEKFPVAKLSEIEMNYALCEYK